MSENDLQNNNECGYNSSYLSKRFTNTKQNQMTNRIKIEQLKKQQKPVFIQTSNFSPQSSQYAHIQLDTNLIGQHNLSHFFVRGYYKSNQNTPIRSKSVKNTSNRIENMLECSPIKQNKMENQVCNSSIAEQESSRQSKKNIQNISFVSQKNLDKSKNMSMVIISTKQDDQEEGKCIVSPQKTKLNQYNNKLLKNSFSYTIQKQKNVNQDNNKDRTDDLKNELVIKSIKPKILFTNSQLINTYQNHSKQEYEMNKQQASPNCRQQRIKNINRERPKSQCSNQKNLCYSGIKQTEKYLSNYLQRSKKNNSFIQSRTRNETPCKDNRITHLSFHTDDMKNQRVFNDTNKNFNCAYRSKTAQLSNRSSIKSQISQTQAFVQPQNPNICNKLNITQFQNTYNLEMQKDFPIQLNGKRSWIQSPPKNQRQDSKSDINQESSLINIMQDQLDDIEQKLQEGFMSPAKNRTNVYNRNILKKHHFVKNVADISLFDKEKKVQMKQFVFDSSSPEKRKSIILNLNNEFFTGENGVDIFT